MPLNLWTSVAHDQNIAASSMVGAPIVAERYTACGLMELVKIGTLGSGKEDLGTVILTHIPIAGAFRLPRPEERVSERS